MGVERSMTSEVRNPDSDLVDGLIRAHASGIPIEAPACVPTVAEAYAIQRRVFARSNLPVMVWKLALTAEAPRLALGSAEPTVGRLAASAIYVNRSQVRPFGAEIYAEAELIFEFGEDLPPRGAPYEPAEVAAAIKGIYAGIELATTRFTSSDLALGHLIADNCLGHGLVLGDRLKDRWVDDFADMAVEIDRGGDTAGTGSTAKVMGSPLTAVTWLANWLAAEEDGLKREQLVASGNCTGITEVFPGDIITARFPGWGQAQVTLLK
jgi:2-keto-4-pentenoate hydratase